MDCGACSTDPAVRRTMKYLALQRTIQILGKLFERYENINRTDMRTKNSYSILLLIFSAAVFFGQQALETGSASYYHNKFQGKKTYSGEPYHKDSLTGAHSTLPMGTMVKVTNLKNDSIVILKINDRLPSKKRVIDVSLAAAKQLNFIRDGIAKVTLEVLSDE